MANTQSEISFRKYVGTCIYCGKKEDKLTNEHIIPFGLNGKWILEKASCSGCNKITTKFEREVLRNILYSARASYKSRSYHGSLPKHFSLIGIRNEKTVEIEVPVEQYGAVICLLEYPLPAYMDNRRYGNGIKVIGSRLVRTNGRDLSELAKELGLDSIQFISTFRSQNFERFLAKVAYGFAIYQFGLDAIDTTYVLPTIRGEKDDVGMWVGCCPSSVGNPDIFVEFSQNQNKDLIVKLHLFGGLQLPTYVVVVGRMK